jgi:hypothetical protein
MGKDLFDALGFRLSIPSSHGVDTCVQCSSSVVSSVVPCTEHRFRTEFAELFKPPEIISGFVHKPQVDTSVQPRVQALRRVPLALQDDVIKEIDRMVRDNVLEPIDASAWVSNMVVCRKSSGGIRICCDLSDVNKAIVPDRYPLPTPEQLTGLLAGVRWLSKLDMRLGYLQVCLDPESRPLTAMIHPLVFFSGPGFLLGCAQRQVASRRLFLLFCKGVQVL